MRDRGRTDRSRETLSRRDLVKAGSLGAVGLSLPELLRAEREGDSGEGRGTAKSCILFFLEAGGGVRPGALYGASDRYAAYPQSHPVTPEDIAATIYHALGLDPEQRIDDALNRPHHLALGRPIVDLFG